MPLNAFPLPPYPAHPAGVDEYIAYAAWLYTRQLEPVDNSPSPPRPIPIQAPVAGPTNSEVARRPPPSSQPSRPVLAKDTYTLGENARIPRKAPPKLPEPDLFPTTIGVLQRRLPRPVNIDVEMADAQGMDDVTQSKPVATSKPAVTPRPASTPAAMAYAK
jgi:hypothetical protein